jgi:hypothetical protein
MDFSAMSAEASLREASRLLRQIARPIEAGDSVKACQRRAHRLLKSWSFNRVRDLWRPDPRVRIKAHEIEQLRTLARQTRDDGMAAAVVRELRDRIERLEKLVAANLPKVDRARDHEVRYRGDQALRSGGARG